jgi:hypothetical protein
MPHSARRIRRDLANGGPAVRAQYRDQARGVANAERICWSSRAITCQPGIAGVAVGVELRGGRWCGANNFSGKCIVPRDGSHTSTPAPERSSRGTPRLVGRAGRRALVRRPRRYSAAETAPELAYLEPGARPGHMNSSRAEPAIGLSTVGRARDSADDHNGGSARVIDDCCTTERNSVACNAAPRALEAFTGVRPRLLPFVREIDERARWDDRLHRGTGLRRGASRPLRARRRWAAPCLARAGAGLGQLYLEHKSITPPERLLVEDLAVTMLLNSRVAAGAATSAFRHGATVDLGSLPDKALEDTSDGERQAVARVIGGIASWRGFGASLATKTLHKKRPRLIPVLDNQAIFGAYMNPRWPGKPSSTGTVKEVPRIKEALDWIAHDLVRPENELAWPHLQAMEPDRSRIELFDMIWWMYFRQIEPAGQPGSSLRSAPPAQWPSSDNSADGPVGTCSSSAGTTSRTCAGSQSTRTGTSSTRTAPLDRPT